MPTPTPAPTEADPGAELLKQYEAAEYEDSTDEAEAAPAPKPATPNTPPPSTPASVAAESPPKHPAALVARARKAGFDDDDLADLSTDDLRDAVATRQAERAAEAAAARVLNAAGRPYDPATGRLLPTNAPAPEAPAEDVVPLGMTAADFEAQGIAPELHGVLQKALAPLYAQIKQDRETIQQLLGSDRRRTAGEVVTKFDKLFAKHADVYGDAPFEELDSSSSEFERRQAVYAALNRLPQDQRTTLEKDFAKAHARLFGSVKPATPPAAPKEPTPEPVEIPDPIAERFANGHALRPTQRNGKPEPKGARRATQAVAVAMRDANIAQEGDTSEHDELPD